MRWIPTIITVVRLICAPVIAYWIVTGRWVPAFVLGFLAGLTDFLDGYLARRFQWTTRIGAWLDAVSDKVLLSIGFIALAVAGRVPVWFVVLVLGRDVLILLMAGLGLIFTRIRDFPPSIWGKLSTIVQLAAGGAIVIQLEPLATGLMYLSAAVTAWSGVHYIYSAILKLRAVRVNPELSPIDETLPGM